MNWLDLTSLDELKNIKNHTGYSIIFKHSTRCSISLMAKKKLELESDVIPANIPAYYLDLLNYREISNAIAEIFQVPHQSPQILLINNGECLFEATHGEISADELAEQIA
ncbi:MAG: bacillithiol system redox-active protein YtxJ [Sphingobacteriaceae bacterium]|nr:bacillithiol system redox-active protein YtxJ [Sphingobacteriaceae bacterium]